MGASIDKKLVPVERLQTIYGIEMPIGMKYRQLIVTGPPGSGKSFLIEKLHGWPNEGYLDLSRRNWWKSQALTLRSREVHLGLPFVGFDDALTVFDKEWLDAEEGLKLDKSRIKIPPAGNTVFQTNWRDRYIFEFLLPEPETVLAFREKRNAHGFHPVDEHLTLEIVQRQIATYAEVALYLHRKKMQVYVRETWDQPPMRIVEKGDETPPDWAVREPASLFELHGFGPLLNRIMGRRYDNWMVPSDKLRELKGEARIAYDGKALKLLLSGQTIHVVPEIPFGARRKRIPKNWILYDPNEAATGVYPHLRIDEGKSVIVGRSDDEDDTVFHFSQRVARRHLGITNVAGDLILTVLDEDRETQICRLPDSEIEKVNVDIPGRSRVRSMEAERFWALMKIARLCDGPLEIMPPDEALALLKNVNDLLLEEPYCPNDVTGRPGALVELPERAATIVVGDLHAQLGNLLVVLSHNNILDGLIDGSTNLVILGDAVHSDRDGELEQMDSSILMMDFLLRLKRRFPRNFFYLRGNHDGFDPEISKHGVSQGVVMKRRLQELRGSEYVAEMQRFYGLLPYIARSEELIVCHAGPPVGTATHFELVNLRRFPKLAHDIVNIRLKSPKRPGGYSKGDVKRLRRCLDVPKKTPLIVGHTPPPSKDVSVWLNAGDIKGNHVIYSSHPRGPAVFLNVGKRLVPVEYPAEPLLEVVDEFARYVAPSCEFPDQDEDRREPVPRSAP